MEVETEKERINEINKKKKDTAESQRKILEYKEQGFIVKYSWARGFELLRYTGNSTIVEIPDGIEYISCNAFDGNSCSPENVRIEKIVFPDSVKEFEVGAVSHIMHLEEIVLPPKITELPHSVLSDCPRLKKITTFTKKIAISTSSLENNTDNSFDKEIIYYGIKLRINMANYYYYFKDKQIKKNNKIIHLDEPEEIVQYIYFENQFYTEILKKIILSTPKDKLHSNIYSQYNEETFIKNVQLFEQAYSLTSINQDFQTQERFSDIIANIFVNNPNFIANSIEDCLVDNYLFLTNQKIVDERIMQSIYFGKIDSTLLSENFKNNPNFKNVIIELLRDSLRRSYSIPELLQTLVVEPNEANQLELLDRITYVHTMRLLDKPTSKKREQAIELLKRTNFENIVAIDKKDFDILTDGRYEISLEEYPIFDGIRISLMTKLSGINKHYFEGLMKSLQDKNVNSKSKNFINSLSTIKHWDEFTDLKYRAICLKNEIVARIIYALIEIKDPTGTLTEETIKENLKSPFPSFNYVLKQATGNANEVFNNENHVKLLLKLDPYAFDALRSNPSVEDISYPITHDCLEKKYIRTAAKQGYVFDTQIKKKFGIQTPNTTKHLLEYINNEIGLAKVPKESKEEYLLRTRKIVQEYVRKNEEGLLFDIIRATDLYMRSNNEYITQKEEKGEDITVTSKRVLDVTNTELSRVDRLLYCMYNFNKLAHNTLDINLKIEYINDRLGLREEEKNKFSNAIKAYNILSKYGLSFDIIKVFIDNNNPIKQELCGESNFFNEDMLIAMLNGIASNKQAHIEIKKEDIPEIKRRFSEINKLSKKDLERIQIYAEEYSLFFETKEIIAEELIKSISTEIDQVVEQVIYLDEEGKKKYYQEHGYIIEVQLDSSGNYILACYSKAYKETFSIHIPNLKEELKDIINQKISSGDITKTIAHTQLIPAGLTLSSRKNSSLSNTTYTQQKNSIITNVTKGFNIRTPEAARTISASGKVPFYTPKADVEYSVALENFISFDLYELQNEIKEKMERVKEILNTGEYDLNEMARLIQYFNKINIRDLFKEFPDILKNNKTIIEVTPTKIIENGIEKDGYSRIEVSMEEYLFRRLGIDKTILNNFINEYGKLQLFQPTEQLPSGPKM